MNGHVNTYKENIEKCRLHKCRQHVTKMSSQRITFGSRNVHEFPCIFERETPYSVRPTHPPQKITRVRDSPYEPPAGLPLGKDGI